jgi:hypothetical protein
MKSIFSIMVAVAILSTSCNKQPKQEEYDNYSKIFFNKYETEGVDKAVNYIFSTNPLINQDGEQIVNLKKGLKETTSLLGDYSGYGLITIKRATNNYVYCSYLVRYNRQPLRFSFIYYKPKDKWVLHKFTFDNEVEKELENAGTIYFLSN